MSADPCKPEKPCVGPTRMQLLRGDLRGGPGPIRPPWAIPEARFVERCTRCDRCVDACPERILERGRGGYPQVDFRRRGCSFCGDCVKACTDGALGFDRDPDQPPWHLKASISALCLSLRGVVCRSCGEVCEERAIRFKLEVGGVARPLLALEECSGCGVCVSVCPVEAIIIEPPGASCDSTALSPEDLSPG